MGTDKRRIFKWIQFSRYLDVGTVLADQRKKIYMTDTIKNAWLIGLYTVDIEARVRSLGYKLTRLYPNLQRHATRDETPSLIVFSNGYFNDMESMYVAKEFFPQTLLISLPMRIESVQYAFDYPIERQPGPSMARLILSIKEREYRWDN